MFVARSPPGAVGGTPSLKPCTICMDENLAPATEPIETKCGHVFHRACLQQWLTSSDSCPVCRQQVNLSCCTKYTGTKSRRYNTRQGNRPAATLQMPEIPPQVSIIENHPRSPTSRPHSANISRGESNISEGPNQSASAQALLSGLRVQIADLVRQEVARGFEGLRIDAPQASPSLPRFSRPSLGGPNVASSPRSRESRNQPEPFQPPFGQPLHRGRPQLPFRRRSASPIRRWQVVYDGDNSRLNVEEFIFRVETLTRNTLHGDYELLVSNLHSLFSERVNDWYWTLLRQNPSPPWEHLKFALRSDWGEGTNDIDIRRKMINRRQRPNECFAPYCQEMVQLRNMLHTPMTETEFVQNLRSNLLPSIQEQICLHRTESVAQLRALVMEIQTTRARIRSSVTHMTHSRPRLDEYYLPETREEARSVNVEGENLAAISQPPISHLLCWNCDRTGHGYQDCEEETRGVFCYGCGRKGVVKPSCPSCGPKNSRGVEINNTRSRPRMWTPKPLTSEAATSPVRPTPQ